MLAVATVSMAAVSIGFDPRRQPCFHAGGLVLPIFIVVLRLHLYTEPTAGFTWPL